MTRREALMAGLAVACYAAPTRNPTRERADPHLVPVWKLDATKGEFVRVRMADLKEGDVFDYGFEDTDGHPRRWRCVATGRPSQQDGVCAIRSITIGYVEVA